MSDSATVNGSTPITPGVIAVRLGVPLHRVQHVLGTRQDIAPIGRAGTLRLYNEAAVAAVRRELDRTDAARRVTAGAAGRYDNYRQRPGYISR